MAKDVLGVDWGGVLFYFDEKHFRRLIRKEKLHLIPAVIDLHESGQIQLRDMYQKLCSEDFFKKQMFWEEFAHICAKCLRGIHEPMFNTLSELKKGGRARLIAITDNNPFFFYLTTLKFPEIFPLFREDTKDRLMISFEIGSVKTALMPYVLAPSRFGFGHDKIAFVDNRADNVAKFIEVFKNPDAGFLYDQKSKRNHAQFLKFLDKHFPAS